MPRGNFAIDGYRRTMSEFNYPNMVELGFPVSLGFSLEEPGLAAKISEVVVRSADLEKVGFKNRQRNGKLLTTVVFDGSGRVPRSVQYIKKLCHIFAYNALSTVVDGRRVIDGLSAVARIVDLPAGVDRKTAIASSSLSVRDVKESEIIVGLDAKMSSLMDAYVEVERWLETSEVEDEESNVAKLQLADILAGLLGKNGSFTLKTGVRHLSLYSGIVVEVARTINSVLQLASLYRHSHQLMSAKSTPNGGVVNTPRVTAADKFSLSHAIAIPMARERFAPNLNRLNFRESMDKVWAIRKARIVKEMLSKAATIELGQLDTFDKRSNTLSFNAQAIARVAATDAAALIKICAELEGLDVAYEQATANLASYVEATTCACIANGNAIPAVVRNMLPLIYPEGRNGMLFSRQIMPDDIILEEAALAQMVKPALDVYEELTTVFYKRVGNDALCGYSFHVGIVKGRKLIHRIARVQHRQDQMFLFQAKLDKHPSSSDRYDIALNEQRQVQFMFDNCPAIIFQEAKNLVHEQKPGQEPLLGSYGTGCKEELGVVIEAFDEHGLMTFTDIMSRIGCFWYDDLSHTVQIGLERYLYTIIPPASGPDNLTFGGLTSSGSIARREELGFEYKVKKIDVTDLASIPIITQMMAFEPASVLNKTSEELKALHDKRLLDLTRPADILYEPVRFDRQCVQISGAKAEAMYIRAATDDKLLVHVIEGSKVHLPQMVFTSKGVASKHLSVDSSILPFEVRVKEKVTLYFYVPHDALRTSIVDEVREHGVYNALMQNGSYAISVLNHSHPDFVANCAKLCPEAASKAPAVLEIAGIEIPDYYVVIFNIDPKLWFVSKLAAFRLETVDGAGNALAVGSRNYVYHVYHSNKNITPARGVTKLLFDKNGLLHRDSIPFRRTFFLTRGVEPLRNGLELLVHYLVSFYYYSSPFYSAIYEKFVDVDVLKQELDAIKTRLEQCYDGDTFLSKISDDCLYMRNRELIAFLQAIITKLNSGTGGVVDARRLVEQCLSQLTGMRISTFADLHRIRTTPITAHTAGFMSDVLTGYFVFLEPPEVFSGLRTDYLSLVLSEKTRGVIGSALIEYFNQLLITG